MWISIRTKNTLKEASGSFEKSNGMFYGFHAGELLKCFGLCLQG